MAGEVSAVPAVSTVSAAIHAALRIARTLSVAAFYSVFGAEIYDQLWTRFL
jgi:hypothetical protein